MQGFEVGGGAWVKKSSSLARCQQLTSKKINILIFVGGGGVSYSGYTPSKSASEI